MLRKVSLLLVSLLIGLNAYGETLDEISTFAGKICDDISISGSITRTKVIATLNGQAGTIAKLIGAKVEADGSITIDNTKYDGLPYADISEQIKGARACKKEVARMIFGKQQAVTEIKSHTSRPSEYVIVRNGSDVFLMREPSFRKFITFDKNEGKVARLIEGTKVILLESEYVEPMENNFGVPIAWRRVEIVSGEHQGNQGWIPEKNIAYR